MADRSPLSLRFGALLTRTSENSILDLDKDGVVAELVRSGAILFRDFPLDLDSFEAFTRRFSDKFLIHPAVMSSDATRARHVVRGYTMTVDEQTYGINPHREMSYTPICPDVIWFYCLTPNPRSSGRTYVSDGKLIWDECTPELKDYMLRRRLRYTYSLPSEVWQRLLETRSQDHAAAIAAAVPGLKVGFREDGSADVVFDAPFAMPTRDGSGQAFANSMLRVWPFGSETEARPDVDDGRVVDPEIMRRLLKVALDSAVWIDWEPNDLLLIDNSRVLHGREGWVESGDSPPRKLVSQMGVANF
jgi:alpha-ketoglutarate-dependent taurine dioxygenase